jgi:hypothetical protein
MKAGMGAQGLLVAQQGYVVGEGVVGPGMALGIAVRITLRCGRIGLRCGQASQKTGEAGAGCRGGLRHERSIGVKARRERCMWGKEGGGFPEGESVRDGFEVGRVFVRRGR